ncbi:EAL domain-containing protein [Halovulum dunhuangense]|uniref:EAL domain-containing protein n=1 Tax=Halovulum dunhuangense TaxID=1505036 RepID=A0A849L096_9RHOB|nr:EAL domain-containing protein [Halovulum dunhuangense]NNU79640.1 EAL domain-containing protein [Halovulum dunhuangense]
MATGDADVDSLCALVERALAEGRIVPFFQPVVDARDPCRVIFHEVLLRLRTRGGRLLLPTRFLPAVAGSPLAAALDRLALSAAIATLSARPSIRLSVNVGQTTLDDACWLDLLTEACDRSGDIGYRLIVEMTEHAALLAHPCFGDFIARLRVLGPTRALDDFGAGATGFQILRNHRFDMLKIDGTYGAALSESSDSQVMVQAMVAIARHFEMLTVLEHVETQEDAAMAVALGVDCLQGHHYGRATENIATATLNMSVGRA